MMKKIAYLISLLLAGYISCKAAVDTLNYMDASRPVEERVEALLLSLLHISEPTRRTPIS